MNRNTLKQAIGDSGKADQETLRKSIGPEVGPEYGRLEEETPWQDGEEKEKKVTRS
jgi:hypothetical protein